MKDAADCNTFKASFPTAMIYCAVEGMTSWGLSVDSWIQMRQRDGKIRSNPLIAALESVSIT